MDGYGHLVRGSRLGDGRSPSQQWSTANGVPSQEVGQARCTNEFGSRRRIRAWLSESTKQLATAPWTRCSPRLSRQARIGRRSVAALNLPIDCGSSRQASSWRPAKPRRSPITRPPASGDCPDSYVVLCACSSSYEKRGGRGREPVQFAGAVTGTAPVAFRLCPPGPRPAAATAVTAGPTDITT